MSGWPSTTRLAHLSDSLFTTAIAIYALALVGYCAEYAFGRKGRIAETSIASAVTATASTVSASTVTAEPSREFALAGATAESVGSAFRHRTTRLGFG